MNNLHNFSTKQTDLLQSGIRPGFFLADITTQEYTVRINGSVVKRFRGKVLIPLMAENTKYSRNTPYIVKLGKDQA